MCRYGRLQSRPDSRNLDPLEAPHSAVTRSDQSISRWMSSSVIGLSSR
jgi:hypothetical protein